MDRIQYGLSLFAGAMILASSQGISAAKSPQLAQSRGFILAAKGKSYFPATGSSQQTKISAVKNQVLRKPKTRSKKLALIEKALKEAKRTLSIQKYLLKSQEKMGNVGISPSFQEDLSFTRGQTKEAKAWILALEKAREEILGSP